MNIDLFFRLAEVIEYCGQADQWDALREMRQMLEAWDGIAPDKHTRAKKLCERINAELRAGGELLD